MEEQRQVEMGPSPVDESTVDDAEEYLTGIEA